MAKLHSYYVLCPLIDQKSFLGVSEDREKENVVVTLGRNVVNKYRLSDQKQIGGWTSKEHITSSVIYDQEQGNYVGVFNNNTIKTWISDNGSLEKLKKYKFPVPVLRLLPRGKHSSLIIFSNGNCTSLSYGLDNRKAFDSKSILKNNESIVDIASYTHKKTDYISYVVKNTHDNYEIVCCPVRNELGDLEKAKLMQVKVERIETDAYVVGKLISTSERPVVYFLWSDSKMTVYDLIAKSWKTIGSVPWISTSSSVSLAWMGEKHLILFGSNIDQDGAIIVAYNISLGVGSCRYPMKMYTEDAKLYCFDNRIVLEASNHIGMLPYVVETSKSLSSLLGSHEVIQDENVVIADWNTKIKSELKAPKDIKSHLSLGLPERTICSQVLTEYIEKDDEDNLYEALKYFQDVPESVLVQLLLYIIKQLDIEKLDVTDSSALEQFCNSKAKRTKFRLLHHVFQIPFCDALLIPYLRNGLLLDQALFLMTYINHLLTSATIIFDGEYESKLFDWAILLMDSFYQQYLMSKDTVVGHVLENMLAVVNKLVEDVLVLDKTLPLLNKLLWCRNIDESEESLSYTIELMQI